MFASPLEYRRPVVAGARQQHRQRRRAQAASASALLQAPPGEVVSPVELARRLPTLRASFAWRRGRLLKRRWKARYLVLKRGLLLVFSTTRARLLSGRPPAAAASFDYTLDQPELARDAPPMLALEAVVPLAPHAARWRDDLDAPHGRAFELRGGPEGKMVFCLDGDGGAAGQVAWADELARHASGSAVAGLSLASFEVLRRLGEGGYGHVELVRDRRRGAAGRLHALKRVPKNPALIPSRQRDAAKGGAAAPAPRLSEARRHVQYLMEERSVLERAGRHPAVASLDFAAEDGRAWYLGFEYCAGGDAFAAARLLPRRRVPEPTVRAWVASLVSALQHLHAQHVVHRDLKPENVLLAADGSVRLGDFGLAKTLRTSLDRTGRTNSFCGTKSYLSPEMLRAGSRHGPGVDWWALGVLTFELLTGSAPFRHPNRRELYKLIEAGEYAWPDDCDASPGARAFVAALLRLEPYARLGIAAEPRAHAFLAGTDWDAVARGEAPEVPLPVELERHLAGRLAADEELVATSDGGVPADRHAWSAADLELTPAATRRHNYVLKGFDYVSDEAAAAACKPAPRRPGLPHVAVHQAHSSTVLSAPSSAEVSPASSPDSSEAGVKRPAAAAAAAAAAAPAPRVAALAPRACERSSGLVSAAPRRGVVLV